MSQERREIRYALRELLLDATAAGSRVDANRATPRRAAQLPALSIYTRSESCEAYEAHGSELRTVRVAIELFTREAAGVLVDDDIDELCEQVETAVMRHPTLNYTPVLLAAAAGRATTITQVDVAVDERGERLAGAARITLDVPYVWEIPEPEPHVVTNLETAGIGYDVTDPEGRIEATDVVPVERIP